MTEQGGPIERLEAENARLRAALQVSEGERRALLRFLDTSALAITIFRRDGTILLVNRLAARNLGGVPAQFEGENLYAMFPELADQTRARIEQALDRSAPLVVQTRAKLLAGERWFQSTYNPVFDGDTPVAVQVVSEDITELKRVEHMLEATEGRLASVLEHAPHFIGVLDLDGVIRFINRAPDALPIERVIGMKVTELLPGTYAARVQAGMDAVRTSAQACLFELAELFGRHWEIRLAPIFRHGEVHQIVAFVLDVTDRQRASERERELEAQVQHAQKLESLGVLAGGIAHDFNNLLVGILCNAQLAQRRAGTGGRDDCLRDIVTAAQRAAELCRQMLAYAGRGQLALASVDLSALAAEILDLVRATLSKRARVISECPAGLPLIEGDATQLRQVVMNLLTNASDALDGNDGVILLSCGTTPEGVYVEVKDTGAGMDAETQRCMFDPFFTTKPRGSGLGLSAVLGIVRRHRGEIHVDSEPGRGTTVRIVLPVVIGQVEEHPAPAVAVPAATGRTILVVDDEPIVRRLARNALEDAGHRVVVAADGVEALERYAEDPSAIDAVLLDLTMPRMDGRQTLTHLRARDRDLPVVLASGLDPGAGDRAAWDTDAATQFLAKPYHVDELLAAMDRALTARSRA